MVGLVRTRLGLMAPRIQKLQTVWRGRSRGRRGLVYGAAITVAAGSDCVSSFNAALSETSAQYIIDASVYIALTYMTLALRKTHRFQCQLPSLLSKEPSSYHLRTSSEPQSLWTSSKLWPAPFSTPLLCAIRTARRLGLRSMRSWSKAERDGALMSANA